MDRTRQPVAQPAVVDLTDGSTRDPVTGLPNDVYFEELVDLAIEQHRRDGRFSAIVFVDLDDLEATNHEHGREAGDQLIRTVAARIAGALTASDVVARFGPDRFTVLRRDLADPGDGLAFADAIRTVVLAPNDGQAPCRAAVGVIVADGRLPATEILRRVEGTEPPKLWRHELSDRDRHHLLELFHGEAASATAILADLLAGHSAGEGAEVHRSVLRALAVAPPPPGVTITIRAEGSAGSLRTSAPEAAVTAALSSWLSSIHHRRATTITITTRPHAGRVEVTIEDDGTAAALPIDDRAEPGGTAVGPVIVSRLAASLGGRFLVTATGAGGQRGTLVLPAPDLHGSSCRSHGLHASPGHS